MPQTNLSMLKNKENKNKKLTSVFLLNNLKLNYFYVSFDSFFLKVSFLDKKIYKIDFVNSSEKSDLTFLSKVFKDFLKGNISRKEMYGYLDFSQCSVFQKKIYKSMASLKVPITYKQLALKNSSSPRAVGCAMSKNPFLLVVPCHLVVSTKGLGGYSALNGTDTKKKLIDLDPFFIKS
jgi:methylated-DNA-[protein]-cysteine S-methyltransferase